MSRMDRRTLLKSVALAAGGAAVSAVAADQVLAAEVPRLLVDAPRKADDGIDLQALTFPPRLAYSGQDFKPAASTVGYSFSSGSTMYWTGGGTAEFVARTQAPSGGTISGVAFYLVNTAATTSTAGLLVWDPVAGAFASIIVASPSASTTGVQTVMLPIPPAGVPIDNAARTYLLYWRSTSAATDQVLTGARITLTLAPGVANFLPAPVRVADTRQASLIGPITGPLVDGGTYDFPIAGANGIPANATAVFGNLTAVEFNPGNGYMSLFPTGAALPTASSINFGGGEPNQLANFFHVKLGTGGKVRLYVSGTSTNAILDIAGYVI